mgnify:CR=1 FL=1
MADGAHNRDAADRLLETLNLYVPEKRKIFIIGVLGDKEYDYMMSRLAPEAERIVTVMTPDNQRALPAKKFRKASSEAGYPTWPNASITSTAAAAFSS